MEKTTYPLKHLVVPDADLTDRQLRVQKEASRRRAEHKAELEYMGEAALRSPSIVMRIMIVRKIADALGEEMRGLTPCESGCSHCCHMAVAVAADEAAHIAAELKIPLAENVPHKTMFLDEPFGRNHPCVFLKAGRCSIYESRPIACRTQFSSEESPEPCSFDELDTVKDVKLVNVTDINVLYVQAVLMGKGADGRLNTLAAWFPGGA